LILKLERIREFRISFIKEWVLSDLGKVRETAQEEAFEDLK
jgi:hypothetical protein